MCKSARPRGAGATRFPRETPSSPLTSRVRPVCGRRLRHAPEDRGRRPDVGPAARRRRSDDGGQSFRRIAFTNVESACKEELRDFWFVDPSTGWILETDGTIVQTKDGGTEFIQRTAVPGTEAAGGDAAPTAVTFITAETGFAAASNGKLY